MTEVSGDSDDLLDVSNVLFSVINGVADLGDSSDDGAVGIDVVCERNCLMCSAKCLNRGMSTWNLWCGGCDVFLVGVVEFAGSGLVGMREGDSCDVGGPVFADAEESRNLLLYAYWSFV